MKRILIYGNSGSGKTTLAKTMAGELSESLAIKVECLDLDLVAWDPPGSMERRSAERTRQYFETFCSQHKSWVIEGCYGSLIEMLLPYCNELHFLNPGIEKCLEHNRIRPWEPHKYDSPEAQNEKFEFLQSWVSGYETRKDEFSLSKHREIFAAFAGPKTEHRE